MSHCKSYTLVPLPPPAKPFRREKCPWCGELITLATDGRRMVCKYCRSKVPQVLD